ncbi:MAG TPA: Ig-like domain-containing protein [Rhodanobacteraceae bacterium]|jgi:pimeloyl-ACP methyl ester carboxylesterase|nr:Ig-like domain-containing protein [Rhodanobacteraceae bacterium]
MQVRLFTAAAVASSLLIVCTVRDARAYDYTAPVQFHGVASFDPSTGVVPFPNNLLLLGSTDLTLNIPVADSTNFGDPKVAMNALDGFSTTAPWSTTFNMPISAASVNGNVHVYQVNLTGPGGAVTGVVRELAPVDEYVVGFAPSDPSGRTMAIIPTKPLEQMTSYMVVLTTGLQDAVTGAPIRASLPYLLSQRTTPLCSGGASTVPALPASEACALEPLRQLTNAQEAAAVAAGIAPGTIALSWVATTESTTVVLQAVDAVVEQSDPAPVVLAPTGQNLGSLGLGLPPVADIYVGVISVPYYLSAPSADDPLAPLQKSWQAQAGGYISQCADFGLDPTSTNLTYCNPFPVPTSTQTIPLVLTIPNSHSGKTKPAAGWPVVIYQHGITRNRTDAFAVAGTLAAQGFAVVAIDLPLHGITDPTNPFYVGNTPFAALGATERTFDLDLENNDTGAPGPDGAIDPSGSWFINLSSLLTSRDNLRQGAADLFELAHAIPSMHISSGSDFDGSRIALVGQSLGSIVGTMFVSIDPNVNVAVLSVPGGGIARLLDGSPTFGPRIRAGLAAAGVEAGTPDYDAFMVAAQTAVDSGDPINFNIASAAGKRLLMQEVVGGGDVLSDQVIPNTVPGAPLSGTEPLIAAYGLSAITQTTQNPDGIRGAVRFLQGEHGSLLDPTDFPAATVEMQGEMASMVVTGGTVVQVANPSIILQQQQ